MPGGLQEIGAPHKEDRWMVICRSVSVFYVFYYYIRFLNSYSILIPLIKNKQRFNGGFYSS